MKSSPRWKLVQEEEVSFSRSPLHLAAWKSDLESIEVIIHAGNRFGLDLVNAIVTGNGNYGKTGKFFSEIRLSEQSVHCGIYIQAFAIQHSKLSSMPSTTAETMWSDAY